MTFCFLGDLSFLHAGWSFCKRCLIQQGIHCLVITPVVSTCTRLVCWYWKHGKCNSLISDIYWIVLLIMCCYCYIYGWAWVLFNSLVLLMSVLDRISIPFHAFWCISWLGTLSASNCFLIYKGWCFAIFIKIGKTKQSCIYMILINAQALH